MNTGANEDMRSTSMSVDLRQVIALHLALLTSAGAFATSLDITTMQAFAADRAHCAWFELGGQVEPDAATVATQLAWATVQEDLQRQRLSPSAAVQAVAKLCGWSLPNLPAAPGAPPPARRPTGTIPLGSKAMQSSMERS